jgi:hypothetical protein
MPPQDPNQDFQPDDSGLTSVQGLFAQSLGGLQAKGEAERAPIEPQPDIEIKGDGTVNVKNVTPKMAVRIQELLSLGTQTKDFVQSGMAQHLTRLAALGQQTQDTLERAAQMNLQKADVLQQHPIIAQLGRTLSAAAANYSQRGSRATPLLNAIGAFGADFFKDTPEGLIQKAAMQRYQQVQAEGETLGALEKQQQLQTEQARALATAGQQQRNEILKLRGQYLDRAKNELLTPQDEAQIKADLMNSNASETEATLFAKSMVSASQEAKRLRVAEETAKNDREKAKAEEARREFDQRQAAMESRFVRGLAAATARAAGGGAGGGFNRDDAAVVAESIINGLQPPNIRGLYSKGGLVRAELARKGYNLQRAESDWNAVQTHIRTLNGQQQERLRQAIQFTADSTQVVENLYNEWLQIAPQTGLRAISKATLAAAKQLPGRPGAIAQTMEAQINDLVSELATVYKGGYTSTDESLKLAAQNLKTDWNEATFKKALETLRTNLRIRKNSIETSLPIAVTPGSPYTPASEVAAQPGAASAAPKPPGKRPPLSAFEQ